MPQKLKSTHTHTPKTEKEKHKIAHIQRNKYAHLLCEGKKTKRMLIISQKNKTSTYSTSTFTHTKQEGRKAYKHNLFVALSLSLSMITHLH